MPSDCSTQYARTVPLKTVAAVSWSIIGNDISFQFTATTTGWVSFGLDVGKEMCNSEDVIGWIPTGGTPTVSAYIVPCDHRSDDTRMCTCHMSPITVRRSTRHSYDICDTMML
jgi:hypothetical protein